MAGETEFNPRACLSKSLRHFVKLMAAAAEHIRRNAGCAEREPCDQIAGGAVNEAVRLVFRVGVAANADAADEEIIHSGAGTQTSAVWHEAQPADYIAVIGQPASFSVDVNGETPFSYQWQKNDRDIIGATNRVYAIRAAADTDPGNYRVIVSNPLGSETSREAALSVTDLPVLSMVLSNPIPVFSVRWFPDDFCAIDDSINLVDWTALETNTAPFTLVDTNAPLFQSRLYRARGNP